MLSNVTVIDFETTGLNPESDRVIEIAAIRCSNGQIISEFSTFVKFNGKLPMKIVELTGIKDEDLLHGFDEVTAFKILNRFIGDSLLVAHNAVFDLSFLHFSLLRLAKKSFNNNFVDTLTLAREIHFYPYTLKDSCNRYDINLEGNHRALNDVLACWEIFKKFNQEVNIKEYINKINYIKKYGPPKWAPNNAKLFPTENKYQDQENSSNNAG